MYCRILTNYSKEISFMKNFSVLIKPSSSQCNLKCTYCFYNDIAKNRSIKDYGIMTEETIKSIIDKTLAHVNGGLVTYAFQGGEPTLAGLDFYKFFHKYLEEKKGETKVQFAIQTNGILINQDWIELFKKYNYLVGISFDGLKSIHNQYRIDLSNKGTYDSILKSIKLLQINKIEYNVLAVVTNKLAKNITAVYENMKELNISYMQFIPIISPINNSTTGYSLSNENYAYFLKTLFDLWYEDLKSGLYVHLDYFENLIRLYRGETPFMCHMMGYCSNQFVLEADGSVYPCDFYVLDEYRLGNINKDSINSILASDKAEAFIEESKRYDECRECYWIKICRNGCKRSRIKNKNKYCEAYKLFFAYAHKRLLYLARHLK